MKSVDEILHEWDRDSVIDKTELGTAILKIGSIKSKYLRYAVESSLLAKKKAADYISLKAVKWDYYKGNMSKEDLESRNWQPFQYQANTVDSMNRWMDKDTDLINVLLMKAMYEEINKLCVDIVKELNNRTYQINGYIKWEEFLAGK